MLSDTLHIEFIDQHANKTIIKYPIDINKTQAFK